MVVMVGIDVHEDTQCKVAVHDLGRHRGDTTMEALRALKRRFSRIVFTLGQPTDDDAAAAPQPLAA